jgi:hypothetical protein
MAYAIIWVSSPNIYAKGSNDGMARDWLGVLRLTGPVELGRL